LKKHFQEGTAEPQISPLRFASVEMTKGRAGALLEDWLPEELQIAPPRFASVEMTKGRAELFLKTGCREELQIAPLRSPGFPVDIRGLDLHHAVFLRKTALVVVASSAK
jgi:hypothetical protein